MGVDEGNLLFMGITVGFRYCLEYFIYQSISHMSQVRVLWEKSGAQKLKLKAAPVTGTTVKTTGSVPADSWR